ncbi:hypothetical protein IS519_13390 [Vibrio crassostreae]|uniref:outer membrane protein OmpK n=1 Tax=Vibrio crassostreae TaxID=246167 RepID=UPI00200B1C26|nr:outer membrane protein OmpK [Vibrio crassostreae]UPR29115.1 hypothetical protein IS519_13390 [Vibrio crassostreae]
MKKLYSTLLASALFASPAIAEDKTYSGWGNLHIDWQEWGHGTSDSDFSQGLIGIEGGLNFEWGEVFGFYDFEGIDRDSGQQTATMNLQAHTYLGESDFSVFTKVYSTQGTEIKETNNFLGFGYTGIGGNGWWFTPWLAGNYTTVYNEFAPTTNTNGFNGGTLGWSAGYVFDAFGESFILSNWTEIEMGRSDEYAENNYGKTGVNGGLNLGWNITNDISATVMYRYYHNKLGNDGYGDILIYRLAYNF